MKVTRALFLTGLCVSLTTILSATPPLPPRKAAALPVLGTQLAPLPAGAGRTIAEGACLQCHSSDMLRQQRLTPRQWTTEVEKMMRWGAPVSDAQKPELIAYLSAKFGPDNKSFKPARTRPVGK